MRQQTVAMSARVATEQTHELTQRIDSQIAFARWLCTRHGREAALWNPLIETASRIAADGAREGGVAALSRAVESAESTLAPMAATARTYELHCVGHAHIDMNWQWSWPQTVAITIDTFTTVLKLMEEFPFFRFSQSQASVYRIVEQFAPELLDRIRERVQAGQWEVTASHWVECDKNMVDGESLCRHLLYTRRYLAHTLGLTPEQVTIDWSPDTFGHAHSVPSYLTRGGVRHVYLHRPGVHTGPVPRPQAFWWQGPCGARVLVRNDMHLGYNGEISPSMIPASLQRFVDETGLTYGMFVYGIGDHGGGPTRRDLLQLATMRTWPIYPTLTPSRAVDFYQKLERDAACLPTIDGELNMEFTGCYTSQSLIKRSNRVATRRLKQAENACVVSSLALGAAYPRDQLEQAWRDTLFSHFHDILPGSGVRDTRTWAHGLFQSTVATTSQAHTRALRALAGAVDTRTFEHDPAGDLPAHRSSRSLGAGMGKASGEGGVSEYSLDQGSGGRVFLLWNGLTTARTEIVEVTIWDTGWGWEDRAPRDIPFAVRFSDGSVQACQTLSAGEHWGHHYVRLCFPASLPPLGYTVCAVEQDLDTPTTQSTVRQLQIRHQCSYAYYERGPEGIENEYLRLELDGTTGAIVRLVDRHSGQSLVELPQSTAGLQIGTERPRPMSAWNVEQVTAWEQPHLLSLTYVTTGLWKTAVELKMRARESDFTVVYELRAGDPTLYVHITGLWMERGSAQVGTPVLRYHLPLSGGASHPRFEIPFGAIERDLRYGEEAPAIRWAGATAAQGGAVQIIADSKHGYSCHEGALNLTLIRASSDPDPLPEAGQHEIHLGIRTAPSSDFAAILSADKFDTEIVAVSTGIHDGQLPATARGFDVTGGAHVLSVKPAESGQTRNVIVRLANPSSEPIQARLETGTLAGVIRAAALADVLERPIAGTTVAVADGVASVALKPREVVTLLLSL